MQFDSWCMSLTCENIVYTSPCCLSPFVSNIRFSIIRPCDLCSIHAHANCTWNCSPRIGALFIDTTCLDMFATYLQLCLMSISKYCCIASYFIEKIDNDVHWIIIYTKLGGELVYNSYYTIFHLTNYISKLYFPKIVNNTIVQILWKVYI